MSSDYLTSELLEEDPGLIDLIERFLTRLPGMQEAIEQAWEAGDKAHFAHLVHQMKGVGGNYGYTPLSELCAAMEAAVRDDAGEDVRKKLTEFAEMATKILAGAEANRKIAGQQG